MGNYKLIPECYICKTTVGSMATVKTIGIYWMCDTCILAEEERTGQIAVFGPMGLEFINKERAHELMPETRPIDD